MLRIEAQGGSPLPDNARFTHPNEAVNEARRLIYVAIPKTGSTAIRRQVMQQGRPMMPGCHLSIRQIEAVMVAFEIHLALGRNLMFPSDDTPSEADVFARVANKFGRYFKFSCVRNPWARVASLYARQEGVQVRERISFETFCAHLRNASDTSLWPTRFQNQADWLCDAEGRIAVDYVIRLENFGSAIAEIQERTGGQLVLQDAVLNRSEHSWSRAYRELYTAHTRILIAQLFEKDVDLFGYTF